MTYRITRKTLIQFYHATQKAIRHHVWSNIKPLSCYQAYSGIVVNHGRAY